MTKATVIVMIARDLLAASIENYSLGCEPIVRASPPNIDDYDISPMCEPLALDELFHRPWLDTSPKKRVQQLRDSQRGRQPYINRNYRKMVR